MSKKNETTVAEKKPPVIEEGKVVGLGWLSDECLAQLVEISTKDAMDKEESLDYIGRAAFEELQRRSE